MKQNKTYISLQKYLYIVFLLIFSVCSSHVYAQQEVLLSDSAKISLLTNSPWDGAVYSLYGHTAVRVNDKTNNIDIAFNYGIFDFNSSNFLYRFVKGETDYMLAGYDFDRYMIEYQMKGISVYEQVLNLTQVEKQNLWNALCINVLPENRVYRYNFFFDNCSTRPRDIIEKSISGIVEYVSTDEELTFRDLIHECVNNEVWVKFGIDLIIGSGADRLATDREKMFLPLYLKRAYKNAQIAMADGKKRDLVANEYYIADFGNKEEAGTPLNYPLIVGIVLFLIAILISELNTRNKAVVVGKTFDTFLFLFYGLAGCIVAFLMFVSEHPCVDANWNLIWLNPIQLFFAFLFFSKYLSKYVYYYHFINFACLSLFLLCWMFIPQSLEIAFLPFIATMCLRSGTNFVVYRRNGK